MYRLSYYLKPADDKWNVCLSVTNIDYFVINQETNPVLNLSGLYKIKFTSKCLLSPGMVQVFGYN